MSSGYFFRLCYANYWFSLGILRQNEFNKKDLLFKTISINAYNILFCRSKAPTLQFLTLHTIIYIYMLVNKK